jgi:two-component system, NtrC family, sensor histidine kinase KinB
MNLKKKILLGYGVVFFFLGLVVAWAVGNLIFLGAATDAILKENYRSILAAENMVAALERQDSAVLFTILGERDKGLALIREQESDFLQWMARAKDNVTIPGEHDLIRNIEKRFAEYRTLIFESTSVPEVAAPGKLRPKEHYFTSIFPLFSEIRETCIQLRQLNESTMYSASIRANTIASRAIYSTIAVASSALILAMIFSLVLSARITNPVKELMEASRKIADGNYSVQVPVKTRDELGLLAIEFNKMSGQLAQYHQMNIGQIIAEKKKVETILATIDDGLVVFSLDNQITDINFSARKMLVLELRDCLGRNPYEVFPDKSLGDQISEAIRTGRKPEINEEDCYITIEKGEAVKHYYFAISVFRGEEGTLSGVVLLLRDVTRLKEVERLKSEFVMAASHELRTPLTSIGMSIDLLIENSSQNLNSRQKELLHVAHEEINRLKALVNDLLDLSRIEAGKIDLDLEEVAVQQLAERVATILKEQIEEKKITVEHMVADDLPLAKVDSNKISWVLTNLVANAVRLLPIGGHIQIAARMVGKHIHVSVHDDGPGVPLEYQSKIFQKFVQIKGSESGGTGLGLAICKEIIRAHGGAIWVESAISQGSTFTFTLPVNR